MPSKKRELMETYEAVHAAQDRILGKKFCSSCQTMQPLDKGRFVATANRAVKRWKCNNCMERKSSPLYMKKEIVSEQ